MSLRDKAVKGAKWSAISTIVIISVNFLQMTLLARIIEPKQFGLLAISMVVIIIADTIADFGISNSIIQKQGLTPTELSTLYWLNVLIGICVFLFSFFISGFLAKVLKQPDLKELVETLSFAFLIIPHGQQFRALLQKELEFSKIGIIESFSVLTGFTVTVISAYIYPFAITAIWGYITSAMIRTILFSFVGRGEYSPKLIFDFPSVKSNFKFGLYLTADNLVNQLNSNIATFILSRTLGAVVAGGYNLAFNVAVIPPSRLNPIITRVLFPALSKIQDDTNKLRSIFYKLLSLVGLLNFPALLGLMVVSDNFVSFVFGEKWIFITPVLKVLCIVGLLRSIGNPIGSLLMAKARVDISLKFNILKLFLFTPAIWIGAHFGGGVGAAIGFLIIQCFNTLLSYFILIKPVLGSSYRDYINSIWLPLRLTLPMIIFSWLVGDYACLYLSMSTVLLAQIISGVIVFALTIVFSQQQLVVELKRQLVKNPKLRRLVRA